MKEVLHLQEAVQWGFITTTKAYKPSAKYHRLSPCPETGEEEFAAGEDKEPLNPSPPAEECNPVGKAKFNGVLPEELGAYFVNPLLEPIETNQPVKNNKNYLKKTEKTTKYRAFNGCKLPSYSSNSFYSGYKSFYEDVKRTKHTPTSKSKYGFLPAKKFADKPSTFSKESEPVDFDIFRNGKVEDKICEDKPLIEEQLSYFNNSINSFLKRRQEKKVEKHLNLQEREGKEETNSKFFSLKMLSYIVPGEEKRNFGGESDASAYASLSEDPSPVTESRPLLGEDHQKPSGSELKKVENGIADNHQPNSSSSLLDQMNESKEEDLHANLEVVEPQVQGLSDDKSPVISEPMSDLTTPGSEDKSIIKSSTTKPNLKR